MHLKELGRPGGGLLPGRHPNLLAAVLADAVSLRSRGVGGRDPRHDLVDIRSMRS